MKFKSIKIIIYKYTIILLTIFLLGGLEVPSQMSAIIYSPDAKADTIDFAISMINDKQKRRVTIENTGIESLKIGPVRPSLSIEYAGDPQHQFDHEEFSDDVGGTRQMTIPPGEIRTINITYSATADTFNYGYGEKFAKFTLGLYNANAQQPTDTNEFVEYKEFYLLARKVKHYLSSYDEIKQLDTVYVNPEHPLIYNWQLFNVSHHELELNAISVEYLTPVLIPDEFIIPEIDEIIMPPKTGPISLEIKYAPKDINDDRIRLGVSYTYLDTTATLYLELYGYAAKQDLILTSSDASNYTIDTLDFGRVWVHDTKEIFAVFGNDGNIDFLSEEQSILEGFEGTGLSHNFSLSEPFPNNKAYYPTSGDTFRIEFEPDRRGSFISRYKIKSNIFKSSIKSIPSEKEYEIFYLKGMGVEPELSSEFESIDFGRIVGHPDCSSSRTFTLNLSNTGNADLQIYNIDITAPFKIDFFDNSLEFIGQGKEDSLMIVFSATPIQVYEGTISFSINRNSPNEIISIPISAERVNPDKIDIKIPQDMRIKPGNKLKVPILVDGSKVIEARTFSAELTFNRSILEYSNFTKLNTASENTDNNDISIQELNGGGKLSISFETPSISDSFLEKDTLINLVFNTYIGDQLSTPIAFINPLFGDGFCDKKLIPNDTNGVVTIDSICGLESKLLPSSASAFLLGDFTPNPSTYNAQVIYQLKADLNLEILLIEPSGTLVERYHNGFHSKGLYELNINSSKFNSGIYILQFRTGDLVLNRKLVISR